MSKVFVRFCPVAWLYNNSGGLYVINTVKRHLSYIVLLFACVVSVWAQDPVALPDSTHAPSVTTCSISGRVVDEDQKPLPFVTVKVEGQVAGSLTSLDGKYSFDFETADSVVINYTLIGYEKKQKVLGMDKAKSWVLLANYRDLTDMMNTYAFELGRMMGLPYTNHTRYVELLMDGEYLGVYQLTEQVQQASSMERM